MAGYIRQSVADIINGANITAPPLNAEFNQLAAAFDAASGHSHDGSNGNAPKIELSTSVVGYLLPHNGGVGGKNNTTAVTDPTANSDGNVGYAPGSLWLNTTTGRVFICLSNFNNAAVWAESIGMVNNRITPALTNTVDLGSSTFAFRNLFLTGGIDVSTVVADALSVDALSVNTSATFTTTPVFNAGVTVNGASQLNGNLTVTGNTQLGDSATDTVTAVAGFASNLVPSTDDTRDLGTPTNEWRNLFIDGVANVDSLNADLVSILGGSINNTSIGDIAPQTIRGTTITATLGFVGNLTGGVTGNVIGNVTGNLTGNVTGNVTGDVTSNNTSTFNNVTINGSLNLNPATPGTITGLSTPVNLTDAATKQYVDINDALKLDKAGGTMTGTINLTNGAKVTGLPAPVLASDAANKEYVDTSVASLIDAAPGALDTLNELAAALGDDQNFAANVYNTIATKVSKSGDTMTGPLAMSGQKLTNVGTPTQSADASTKGYTDAQVALKVSKSGDTMTGPLEMSGQKVTGVGSPTLSADASNKQYVDQQDALKVSKAGDSMTGPLSMGLNKITDVESPLADSDAANKGYVDGILGSATAASISAAAALASQQAAAASESNAAQSASTADAHRIAAQTALSSTQAVYDSFDDRYLGPKASGPATDNDGDPLIEGTLYWNTTEKRLYGWNGTSWSQSSFSVEGAVASFNGREGAVVLNATDISEALSYVPASQADLSSFQTSINASLSSTQANVDSQITTLTAYVNTEVADLTTYVDGQIVSLQTTVDGQIQTLQTDVNTQLATQNSSIQSQFDAQNQSINAQLAAQDAAVQASIGNIKDIERKFVLPKGITTFKAGNVVKSGAILGGTYTVAQGSTLYIATGGKLVFHTTSATSVEAENFIGFDTVLTSDKVFDGYVEVAPTVALTVNANVSLEVVELTDFR